MKIYFAVIYCTKPIYILPVLLAAAFSRFICFALGANSFIASGAKILGAIVIADDVAIGANAVVVKSITESGTTWAGVPARKISDNNSHKYFPSQMGLE